MYAAVTRTYLLPKVSDLFCNQVIIFKTNKVFITQKNLLSKHHLFAIKINFTTEDCQVGTNIIVTSVNINCDVIDYFDGHHVRRTPTNGRVR